MAYEYNRYSASPSGYVRRGKNTTDVWEDVPIEDFAVAESAYVEEKLAGAMAAEEGRLSAKVTRSPQNIEAARSVGLAPDELAELLNSPTRNSGTRKRLAEEDFDALAGMLGMTPQEARDRFSGRFWG